ncbi:hypothetical protein FA95DRAFT_1578907 [Auriscalpium vulgare]|uniref:Uncharacterized protein n=1 Tax=Auriscalpium vulgare TaxID=40419 RepID=A0ACB8QZM7_9AGAM|nr:hypothetical protein FA95DRAFT_1578907 [Auriscalpium vulgare]
MIVFGACLLTLASDVGAQPIHISQPVVILSSCARLYVRLWDMAVASPGRLRSTMASPILAAGWCRDHAQCPLPSYPSELLVLVDQRSRLLLPSISSIYREMRASTFIVIIATALASAVHAAPVPSNPSTTDALAARDPSALEVNAGNNKLTLPRSAVIAKRLPAPQVLNLSSVPEFLQNLILQEGLAPADR